MTLHAFTSETPLTVSTGAYSVQPPKMYSQSGTTMYYITPQGSGAVDIKVKVPSSAPTLYFFTVPNMVNQVATTAINNVPVVDDGTYKTYTVTVNNLNLLITYKYSSSLYYGYNPTSVSKTGSGTWVDADLNKMATTWGLGTIHEYSTVPAYTVSSVNKKVGYATQSGSLKCMFFSSGSIPVKYATIGAGSKRLTLKCNTATQYYVGYLDGYAIPTNGSTYNQPWIQGPITQVDSYDEDGYHYIVIDTNFTSDSCIFVFNNWGTSSDSTPSNFLVEVSKNPWI